jgi:hypothetical protein
MVAGRLDHKVRKPHVSFRCSERAGAPWGWARAALGDEVEINCNIDRSAATTPSIIARLLAPNLVGGF